MAFRLPLSFLCALLAGASHAAELGEPRVGSFIGQPLVADIELVMLEDATQPVAVRLAHPEVYRGANVAMAPVLSSLNMSVMRRDGRQFLHVTSLKPVDAAHLHLFLELADGSQRTVRLATLWLAADPNPAPPPPVPVPAAAAVIAAPAPQPVRAHAEPARVVAAAPVPPAPPAPAPAKAVAPRPAAPKPAPPKAVATVPAAEQAPADKPAASALPVGSACAPQPVPSVDACAVLGARNTVLREQLGQLEDKVKVLQVAMGAPASAVVPPVKPYKPKIKKAETPPSEAGTPWGLIGGGIAAVLALAAAVVLLRRRKKAGPLRRAEPKVGLLTRLRARFRRKPAPVKTAGPSLQEVAHDSSTQD